MGTDIGIFYVPVDHELPHSPGRASLGVQAWARRVIRSFMMMHCELRCAIDAAPTKSALQHVIRRSTMGENGATLHGSLRRA